MWAVKATTMLRLIVLCVLTAGCADTGITGAAAGGDTTDGGDLSDRSAEGSSEQPARDRATGTPGVAAPAEGDGTFTVRTETFVDGSRPTTPGTAARTLVTDIYVPGGRGPFPAVVHAHGMDGTSAKFSQLLSHWAEAGYLVVAPNFPRTNGDAPPELRDLADYLNQPADLTYVLDRVLEMNEPGGELEGLVAADRIGISGLSLGGATAYPLLFNDCCRDGRYASGILMSALELPFGDHPYDFDRRVPVLTFAGTDDATIPFEIQQDVISKMAGPKWDVTLPGGQHSQPFENNPSPHDELVLATTVDFWDLTLRGEEAAKERLVEDATVEGLSFVDLTP